MMGTDIQFAVDAEGYLVDPAEWNEAVAEELASGENIELNDDYWRGRKFMRDYWTEHHIAPDVRHVVSHLAKSLELDKKTAKERLFKLFPYGYVQQACKLAGMQKPRAWSTG